MKIVSLVLHGNFTDGMGYQENCLPYYQMKVFQADVVIVASQFSLKMGTNKSEILPSGESYCLNGIRLIRLPSSQGRIGKKLARLYSLYETLENEKPDYIFVHLIQSVSIRDVVKYKKKHPDVKVYGDNHADYVNSAHSWLSINFLHKFLWRCILKNASRYFEKIYGVLPGRVSFLKEMYGLPDEKIGLLLMGAEDEKIDYTHHIEIKNRIRSDLQIGIEDFVIITGGKIDKKKNIKVLVDSIKELNDRSIFLLVFGSPDEEMKSYMESIVEYDFVRALGWIGTEEMYEYFHAADLCVFPGTHSVIWEQAVGFGLPGIFRHWDGIEHIDCNGNMRFFYNNSNNEMEELLKTIIYSKDYYSEMKQKAINISREFHYSTLAYRSLGK